MYIQINKEMLNFNLTTDGATLHSRPEFEGHVKPSVPRMEMMKLIENLLY